MPPEGPLYRSVRSGNQRAGPRVMVWAERAMSNQTNHGTGTGDHCSTVSRNLGSTATRACIFLPFFAFLCRSPLVALRFSLFPYLLFFFAFPCLVHSEEFPSLQVCYPSLGSGTRRPMQTSSGVAGHPAALGDKQLFGEDHASLSCGREGRLVQGS
ncbi:hypothetical protein ASPTUDRAFT_786528 [Aspergillus tubingensis CBS 134.48]|uniref:Uncharacterized protein n=1 Tax=Aspergillus tubingensis (strain CBS 134.48) TaxID=767770 RepID=A0A1L9MUX5_ASPTC|nr:hypothetical protein ASPTUDRAFT_786528 [Aspergillus tubingensis CBS 134.48]